MRQTLFYIPPEIAGVPLFGIGIALVVWLVVSLLILLFSWRKHGLKGETIGHIPVLAIVALAIVFVLPRIEIQAEGPDGPENLGLPIRGYGVMVLLAVLSGVGLAIHRCGKVKINAELVMNLAFAIFLSGIVGARLFFVIQYWDEFQADSFGQTLVNMLSFVEGGLVVYGSLIGAMVGFVYYCRKKELPLLPVADLIAPSLFLGLAIGRIGCLMNGCCFGGVCDQPWAIHFPEQSPPYDHQHSRGLFHGIRISDAEHGVMVAEIVDESHLGDSVLAVGDAIGSIDGEPIRSFEHAEQLFLRSRQDVKLGLSSGRSAILSVDTLPEKSLGVHPTQIYSTMNALLICAIGLTLYPFAKRDGQVIAVVLSLYAVTRFIIENIRKDEGGFLAGLTISQNVSLLMGALLLALWGYVLTNKKPRFFAVK